ncbi:response regulator [Flavobacterium artemisiae]|uniref:Response regulator n=1 Tax=Flavobacterium artemisiae TaxID=2126556 RepID=A0ABW4HK56_9FLAO
MKIVFLIDDDADDREIFADSLSSLDSSIMYQEAVNGQDAFEKLLSGTFPKPDLIFLDLNMPIMDGRTFLKKIKEHKDFSAIPVIIYSTSSSDHDKQYASQHQAAMFLTKQYSIALLTRDIKQAIENFLGV